jgi:hypothetical protein
MLRAAIGSGLIVLAALSATAAGAATANAATADTFTVVSAGASASNADQLTVVVDSPSTISDLAASLDSDAPGAYAAMLTQTASQADPSDSTQTQTTWTADIPAGTSLDSLGAGVYAFSLAATYSDGSSSTLPDAGSYGFYPAASVTLSASSTDLDYPSTSTTISGQLTLTYPDGTADANTADYTSAGITFVETSGADEGSFGNVPVSGTGAFSTSAFDPQWTQSYEVDVLGSAGIRNYFAVSNVVTLNVTTTTPTLTITSRPATVTFGKAATVTGRLTYPTGTTQAPVAGQLVWGSTSTNGTGNTYATTDANGDFTLTMPKVASASATVYVGTYAQNLLNATQDTFKLAGVIHPTQVESPSVKLDQYWDLSVKGCLSFPSGDTTQSFTSTAGLELQYQVPDGKSWSAWKNLAAIPSNEKAAHCGTGGTWFTDTLKDKAPSSYANYRVVYKGTTGATRYASSASATVLAWRYADRIASYRVSSKSVRGKHVLTFTGVLQYLANGKWNDYSGQDLELNLDYKNAWYYWTKSIRTNSKGQFSYTLDAPGTATWNVEFLGNNSNTVGHLAYVTPDTVIKA